MNEKEWMAMVSWSWCEVALNHTGIKSRGESKQVKSEWSLYSSMSDPASYLEIPNALDNKREHSPPRRAGRRQIAPPSRTILQIWREGGP